MGLMQLAKVLSIHVQLAHGKKPKKEKRGDSSTLCDSWGSGIPDMYRSCLDCKLYVRPFVLMTHT